MWYIQNCIIREYNIRCDKVMNNKFYKTDLTQQISFSRKYMCRCVRGQCKIATDVIFKTISYILVSDDRSLTSMKYCKRQGINLPRVNILRKVLNKKMFL